VTRGKCPFPTLSHSAHSQHGGVVCPFKYCGRSDRGDNRVSLQMHLHSSMIIPFISTPLSLGALFGVVCSVNLFATSCSTTRHVAQNTPRAAQGGTTIGDMPADTCALAKMLHFCWKFDQGKMMQPGIQNDFAGYVFSRKNINNTDPSFLENFNDMMFLNPNAFQTK
jgi:hypothetical protein